MGHGPEHDAWVVLIAIDELTDAPRGESAWVAALMVSSENVVNGTAPKRRGEAAVDPDGRGIVDHDDA